MALHPSFPSDPHVVLDPAIRWFPADETLREKMGNLMPPLVPELRKQVKKCAKVVTLVRPKQVAAFWIGGLVVPHLCSRGVFFTSSHEPESTLARNFLVIAPNIIVLDRIYKDFQGLKIFFHDPVIPYNGFDGHNWLDDFQLTLHVQNDVRVSHPTGNIFLTNIHRVYAGDDIPASPDDENSMDYFLGKRPTGSTTESKVDLGMIVRDIDELAVLNDEAHHIHDPRMAWFKSIEDIHNRLVQKGSALSLQIDVTATPKHNNGAIFVQTVADYTLLRSDQCEYVQPDGPERNRHQASTLT